MKSSRPYSRITFSQTLLLALGILLLLGAIACHPQGKQYRQWMRDKKARKIDPGPPNMVFIPSGTYIAGDHSLGTSAERYTVPHKVEVEAFYLDRTEVSNASYVMYLNYLRRKSDDLEYRMALPDTQVWYEPLTYNEPMVSNYLRHPAFKHYPVVGVNWVQAMQYCEWRSGRINELDSLSENEWKLRLPTEDEWEYAAIANYNYDEIALENQHNFSIRQESGFGRGAFMHNFLRRGGDAQGVSHKPNDAAHLPAPVYMYQPNDYGLYNMYGNVAEWVSDEYKPITIADIIPEEDELAQLKVDSTNEDVMEGYVDPNATFNNVLKEYGIESLRDPGEERVSLANVQRVYKGASWSDRAYYLQPGTRRFLEEKVATSYIGFRCAATLEERTDIEAVHGSDPTINNSGIGGPEIEYIEEEEEQDVEEEGEGEEENRRQRRRRERQEEQEEESEEEGGGGG